MSALARNPRLYVALGALGLIALVSIFAPWIAGHDPRVAAPENQLLEPSREYPFGTDLLGRDVFSRVVYGGRRTLGVALLTVVVTLLPGIAIGLAAGYAGRWLDWALMSVMDALLAFPSLLLALALVTVFGSGMVQIAFAVGIAGIPRMRASRARLCWRRAPKPMSMPPGLLAPARSGSWRGMWCRRSRCRFCRLPG